MQRAACKDIDLVPMTSWTYLRLALELMIRVNSILGGDPKGGSNWLNVLMVALSGLEYTRFLLDQYDESVFRMSRVFVGSIQR